MDRAGLKTTLFVIAVLSTGFWWRTPVLQVGPVIAVWCGLWSVLCAASWRWSKAEDWSYRISSFLGVALATMEAAIGLTSKLNTVPLLVMALIHSAAFVLAIVGRYKKVSSKRVSRL